MKPLLLELRDHDTLSLTYHAEKVGMRLSGVTGTQFGIHVDWNPFPVLLDMFKGILPSITGRIVFENGAESEVRVAAIHEAGTGITFDLVSPNKSMGS